MNLVKSILNAIKDAAVHMFGLEAVFGPKTGPEKKAAVMAMIEQAIGLGEQISGKEIVNEDEFVAGLDQAAEGVLRALKATRIWNDRFGS